MFFIHSVECSVMLFFIFVFLFIIFLLCILFHSFICSFSLLFLLSYWQFTIQFYLFVIHHPSCSLMLHIAFHGLSLLFVFFFSRYFEFSSLCICIQIIWICDDFLCFSIFSVCFSYFHLVFYFFILFFPFFDFVLQFLFFLAP